MTRSDSPAAAPFPALPLGALRAEIVREYADIAMRPEAGRHVNVGPRQAKRLGYAPAQWSDLPARAAASFAGTGNPFAAGTVRPGETVVDAGCGSGLDALIAARFVGPAGRVIGVDLTPEMLRVAGDAARMLTWPHVAWHQAVVEALPLPDACADVVISNGVLNLTPDKLAALNEWARVLKPGGRLLAGDVLSGRPLTAEEAQDPALWSG